MEAHWRGELEGWLELFAATLRHKTPRRMCPTEALRKAYEGTYKRNLAYTLAFNMSGTDMEAAQALLKQGRQAFKPAGNRIRHQRRWHG